MHFECPRHVWFYWSEQEFRDVLVNDNYSSPLTTIKIPQRRLGVNLSGGEMSAPLRWSGGLAASAARPERNRRGAPRRAHAPLLPPALLLACVALTLSLSNSRITA